MGIAQLREYADAEVRFQARATAVEQDSSGVSVTLETPNGTEQMSADYLVGADGGRSTIRKAIEVEFEGYTWPEQCVVLTTLNDFQRAFKCCYRNYFADPDEWVNLFKVAGEDLKGRWRAVFPTRAGETDEEALSPAAAQERLQKAFPLAEPYCIVHTNLYKTHQRVAARFRVGRVFLAGDSAHVNNPIGGLGLNCGIHDAMELVDTLHQVVTKQAQESLIDRYERRRRPINIEFVQQTTIANKKRLEESNPEVRKSTLEELRRTAEDPETHKQFLMRTSLLQSLRKAEGIA